MDLTSEAPIIRIGDIILLKQQKIHEGYLCSSGVLCEDLYLSAVADELKLEDSLFQVHTQCQYSALQEYEEYLLLEGIGRVDEIDTDIDFDFDDINFEYLYSISKSKETTEQLLKCAINERRLNEKLMKMKIGKPISFGDIIQLKHMKSGKFLTVSKNLLAKYEKGKNDINKIFNIYY